MFEITLKVIKVIRVIVEGVSTITFITFTDKTSLKADREDWGGGHPLLTLASLKPAQNTGKTKEPWTMAPVNSGTKETNEIF